MIGNVACLVAAVPVAIVHEATGLMLDGLLGKPDTCDCGALTSPPCPPPTAADRLT